MYKRVHKQEKNHKQLKFPSTVKWIHCEIFTQQNIIAWWKCMYYDRVTVKKKEQRNIKNKI